MQPTPDTETRIFGPPGCGKTSYLTRQIAIAAEVPPWGHPGYQPHHCRRLRARWPRPARRRRSPRHAAQPLLPHPRPAQDRRNPNQGVEPPEPRSAPLSTLHRSRRRTRRVRLTYLDHRRRPVDTNEYPARAPRPARPLARLRATLRRQLERLETAEPHHGLYRPPRKCPAGVRRPSLSPDVIVGDEAQDFTRLALALLRQWGRSAEHLLLAADDDQTLFGFAVADPLALLEDGQKIYFEYVLGQSYRLPRRVYALAERWVHELSQRKEKHYQPRDAEGEVRVLHRGTWCDPDPVLNDAERYLSRGKSVMFLATCRYMLERLLHALRDRGWPFFNPYRLKSLPWNPLTSLAATNVYAPNHRRLTALEKHGIFPADRLLDFLHRLDSLGRTCSRSTATTRPAGYAQSRQRKRLKEPKRDLCSP